MIERMGKEHIGLDSRAWCLARWWIAIPRGWMDVWLFVWRFMACSDLDMRDSWMVASIYYGAFGDTGA